MNKDKRLIAGIVEVIIGIILVLCGHYGMIDAYWSGMGTALVFVGVIFIFRQLRYNTNEEYKEQVDIEVNDERNKYLRLRAWASAGYCFVLISAVCSIIFRVMGRDTYSILAGGAVCLLMVLFWISYLVLKRKY